MPSISNAFCFDEAGKAYGISPSLLSGIARVESGLNPHAINRNFNGSIDIGVMQINSSWIPRLRLDSERLLSDVCYNVMTGAKVLRLCIDRYGYTWEAVGCYNAVSRQKRINYSWKVFNMLKAEGKRKPLSRHSEPTHNPSDSQSNRSSFYFSVRDTAAIE